MADPTSSRPSAAPQLCRDAAASHSTEHGRFTAIGYADDGDGGEHLALVVGPVDRTTPVYIHPPVDTSQAHLSGAGGAIGGVAECVRRVQYVIHANARGAQWRAGGDAT